MKIHKNVRIQLACAGGDRESNCYAHLSVDKGKPTVLVATNQVIAAVVPVDLEKGDKAGLIPRTALVAAQLAAPKNGEAHLICKDKIELPEADQVHGRPDVTTPFPNWRPIVPSARRREQRELCLDVTQLAQLARALGTTWVKLLFVEDPKKPIRVEALGGCPIPSAHGAIMPITEDDIAKVAEPEDEPGEDGDSGEAAGAAGTATDAVEPF